MKIGFICLGIMGKPMAKNLLKAGYSLVVCDINKANVDELVAAGASCAASGKEVAMQTETILTMLPNSPQVKEVVLGPGGVIESIKNGSILVDKSSINPLASREIEIELKKRGAFMIDAPVSGGEPKAKDGTLAFMVGGEENIFNKVKPILEKMGSTVTLTGETGSGNITKLANQIIVALNIAAMSEALTLATKAGVDPEKVYKAIRAGLAGSNVLDAKAPMVLNRNFEPGFRIELHIKDLMNALDTAHEIGVPLPLTSQVFEILQALKVEGLEKKDHSAIALFYEKLANIEIKKN